jgi:hypothetical protein
MGTGEHTLFMTEKLGVDQFERDSPTVDCNKGSAFSLAGSVDRTREVLLADPGLPLDQYGQIPLRQSLRHRDYTLHRLELEFPAEFPSRIHKQPPVSFNTLTKCL